MAWLPARRERILIYGSYKVGKSTTYISLMKFAKLTKTNSHFHIIDNDNASEAIGLFPGGTYGDLLGEQLSESMDDGLIVQSYENATIYIPETFDVYHDVADSIRANVNSEDWIVIDMLSNVWEIMPDWWVGNVYGDNPWEYYAKVRKAIESGEEGAGERGFGGHSGVDWQYIGKVYRAWEKKLVLYAPCHVIAYSGESEILPHHDKSGAKRAQFSIANNFAPRTEKGTPHRVHTVARMTKRVAPDGNTVKERSLVFVGDRDREELLDEKLGRGATLVLSDKPKFYKDYLIDIAGWKMSGG